MRILVTGGAGFIGSNVVEALLIDDRVKAVRVLDNFSTGFKANLDALLENPKLEVLEGDICDPQTCNKACEDIDAISHQAALGSVPRSINDPLKSHNVNVNGFINMLQAARGNAIRRVVYASSSSIYGDIKESPKVEPNVGKVLSPYAATKMTNELYAEAFSKTYDMQIFGFRYFNVFGPKQDPFGPYAAVIPLFIKAALSNTPPLINGDGSITRDFTPVSNVVQININGLLQPFDGAFHSALNVACGNCISLNDIWTMIRELTGSVAEANYGPIRLGDIMFSKANVDKAKGILGYSPDTNIKGFLEKTIAYYRSLEKASVT